MAFEIQEIAIQMHVADGGGQSGQSGSAADAAARAAIEREALVRECVRRVLLALKNPGER